MSVELNIIKRTEFGKYNARFLKKEKMVPAVAYNKGKPAMHFTVDFPEFLRLSLKIRSEKIVLLKSDQASMTAIIKSIDRDPVSDLPIHIDFHIVEDGQKIRTQVPIEIVNQNICAALKAGGFLNLVKRKIQVYCDAQYLPKSLPIDVKDATIGASIRISDFTFPENVECPLDPYMTVITISGKKATKTKDADEVSTEAAESSTKPKEKSDSSSKPKKEAKKPKAAAKK